MGECESSEEVEDETLGGARVSVGGGPSGWGGGLGAVPLRSRWAAGGRAASGALSGGRRKDEEAGQPRRASGRARPLTISGWKLAAFDFCVSSLDDLLASLRACSPRFSSVPRPAPSSHMGTRPGGGPGGDSADRTDAGQMPAG